MLLRRLMAMPRYYFAQVPQSVEGTSLCIQATSHQPLPILLPADMLDHFSVLLPRPSACRLSLLI